MKKSGFAKEDSFQAHKDKDWRVVHDIYPNIRAAVGRLGPKGSVGVAGITGPQGPAGDSGPQGATGPGGVTGPQGNIGESGPVGPTGPGGVTGPQGSVGESGPIGPTGPGGVTGPQGTIGESGPTGASGPTGVQGPQGQMGERGIGHSLLGPGCVCYLPMIAGSGATLHDLSRTDYTMGLMNFDSGSVEPVLGERLTGATSGATAIVVSVNKTGGTWGGGDAAGSIVLEDCDGCFNDDENVNGSVGGANILTVNHPDGVVGIDKLVKNGAFVHDNDPPNDWEGSATLTTEAGGQVGNCMMLTANQNHMAYNIEAIATITGKTYKLTFYEKKGTATDLRVLVYKNKWNYIMLEDYVLSADWTLHSITFVAESTTTYIAFQKTDSGGVETLYIDEVTLYEIKGANDGTIEGAQWAFSEISGQCLDFDGENDYVNCGADTSLNITSTLTIAAWVYSRGDARYEHIVSKRVGNDNTHYGLLKTNNQKIMFEYGSPTGAWKGVIGDNFPLNEWVHVAVTVNGLAYQFYINGQPAGNGNLDNTIPSLPTIALWIGHYDGVGDECWNGLIDEVRIYARALTEPEIALAYKQIYLTGAQGEQGPTGISGVVGPQGSTGVEGPQGPSGISGVQGEQGISGPQGEQGPSGISGVQGEQGISGVEGPQGPSGMTGPSGAIGESGPQGPTGIPGGICYSTASTTTRNSNDTEKSTANESYVKLKETKLNEATGEMKIYFELKTLDADYLAYGRIYKNGTPLSSEFSTNSLTYVSFDQDLGPFVKDDLIQLYVKSESGLSTAYVRYLRFQYDRAITVVADFELTTPLSVEFEEGDEFNMTHQDP